jgi:hypothetical protein
MALTVTIKKTDSVGRYLKVKTGSITFDSSYPTSGEALTAANLGFSTSVETFVASPAGGLIFEYDFANSKLKAHYPTGGTAPASLANPVTSVSVAVAVPVGQTAVESDAAQPDLAETVTVTQAAGRSAEVANTTDLSSITTNFVAFGY